MNSHLNSSTSLSGDFVSPEIEKVMTLVRAGIALTTKQAGIFLNVSSRTLDGYRISGCGPRYVKIGRSVRYPVEHLLTYRNARLHNSTSEACK